MQSQDKAAMQHSNPNLESQIEGVATKTQLPPDEKKKRNVKVKQQQKENRIPSLGVKGFLFLLVSKVLFLKAQSYFQM